MNVLTLSSIITVKKTLQSSNAFKWTCLTTLSRNHKGAYHSPIDSNSKTEEKHSHWNQFFRRTLAQQQVQLTMAKTFFFVLILSFVWLCHSYKQPHLPEDRRRNAAPYVSFAEYLNLIRVNWPTLSGNVWHLQSNLIRDLHGNRTVWSVQCHSSC